MDIRELHLPENHQETTIRFVAACQADHRIVAAFLGGSYARGEADQFSDLDLYFVTTDDSYKDFLVQKASFAHQLGEPLFLEDFGVPHGYCFMLSNTTEGEFWFGPESRFQDIYSGPYKVLLDKKNILVEEALPASIADQTMHLEVLQRQIDWFWHELSHFVKAIGRRQLWFAYGQIEAMRRICTRLARLKHNFLDAYLEEDEPYFKIEQALPIEDLSSLQSTFCPMEYDAMLRAAFVLCGFYQDIAPELAKAHQLTYQAELERMLIGQLQGLSQASSRR